MHEIRKKDILIISVITWIILLLIFLSYKLTTAEVICFDGLDVDEYNLHLECGTNFTEYQEKSSMNSSFCIEGKRYVKEYGGCEKQYAKALKRMVIPIFIWLIPIIIISYINWKDIFTR